MKCYVERIRWWQKGKYVMCNGIMKRFSYLINSNVIALNYYTVQVAGAKASNVDVANYGISSSFVPSYM